VRAPGGGGGGRRRGRVTMATPSQRPVRTAPGPLLRTVRAWRALEREQRLSAIAALALWVTMFLPWYSESGLAVGRTGVRTGGISLTAWSSFSWVEAAVLLVSGAVLALLFARGERRAFHLPFGDGGVITLAGGWVALLIVYRMFDKTSTKTVAGAGEISTGIEWGIFFALLAALWLTWSGVAMRRAHRAEPALAEDPTVHLREQAPAPRERRAQRRAEPLAPVPARRERREEDERPHPPHRGVTREDAEQLSFDLPDDPRRD
jgi:hypothetical protein